MMRFKFEIELESADGPDAAWNAVQQKAIAGELDYKRFEQMSPGCPKCYADEFRTVGWCIESRKEYYVGDECEDGKFLDIVSSGTDPDAETVCGKCGYESTARAFGMETCSLEEFLKDVL